MKLTCEKKLLSNCCLARLWVWGLVESSSTVATMAAWEVQRQQPGTCLARDLGFHTLGSAAEQNVNASKHLDRFGDGRYARAHVAVAPNAPDAILPSLAVFAIALAFSNKLSKLGAALLMVDLLRRQARDDVVPMREQLANEAHSQWRQGRGQQPCAW
jgi:hypothetical protein